jgi:glucose dehydrogenase
MNNLGNFYFNIPFKLKLMIAFLLLIVVISTSAAASAYNNNNTSNNNSNSNNYSISLQKSKQTELGTEPQNHDNWITANHDIFGTRSSNQTVIGKDSVNKLEIKWRLNNDFDIEDPPIVINHRGYVQDYDGTIIAFDTDDGHILWRNHVGTGPTMGLTYDHGELFASTAYNATAVAIDATNGDIIWQSKVLGNPEVGYNVPSAPIVWKDYVVVGSAAGGDNPAGVGLVRGNITALNRTTGDTIWNLHTTTGQWVSTDASPYNSGATAWSDGSLDPETGVIYIPVGNPHPAYNATTRQMPNQYANHMLAVNITNGKLIWATPFLEQGTVIKNVKIPDTHDWDTSWGSSITKVKFEKGTQKKIVIGHDKMGNVIAMDAATGKPLWWRTLGKQYNTESIPSPKGSGMVWSYGINSFHAVYDDTLYIAAVNRGVNYFADGIKGHRVPAPHTIELGLHNGTIDAIDIRTGKTKWEYPTAFPPRVSPLVTNGLVFAGYIPFTEKAKIESTANAVNNNTTTTTTQPSSATITHTVKSGVILALDRQTGKKVWEFDLDAPIGAVGPSIGDGMLFVPTGKIQGLSKEDGGGGSIVAFGLPPS